MSINAVFFQGLSLCGNIGNGLYYYLNSDIDLGAAIGDCLGSIL